MQEGQAGHGSRSRGKSPCPLMPARPIAAPAPLASRVAPGAERQQRQQAQRIEPFLTHSHPPASSSMPAPPEDPADSAAAARPAPDKTATRSWSPFAKKPPAAPPAASAADTAAAGATAAVVAEESTASASTTQSHTGPSATGSPKKTAPPGAKKSGSGGGFGGWGKKASKQPAGYTAVAVSDEPADNVAKPAAAAKPKLTPVKPKPKPKPKSDGSDDGSSVRFCLVLRQ